jgi:hypothetical protein
MDRVTKVTAFKTADGKLHEDAQSARVSVLRQLVEEAVDSNLAGEIYKEDVVRFVTENFDKLSRDLDRIMGSVRA